MKGRDVRAALDGNTDPKVVHCIASVAEEVQSMSQEITALAQLLNQITDVLAGIVEVSESVRDAVERSGVQTNKLNK